MHALEECGSTPHLLCILQRGEQFAPCIFFPWETRAGSTCTGWGCRHSRITPFQGMDTVRGADQHGEPRGL